MNAERNPSPRTKFRSQRRALRVELRELRANPARDMNDIHYGSHDAVIAERSAVRRRELESTLGMIRNLTATECRRRSVIAGAFERRAERHNRAVWDAVGARVKALPATATREERIAEFFQGAFA